MATLPSYWKYLYRETVMDLFKKWLQPTTRKMATFFIEYICNRHLAMETDTKNITAKDLRLKCIILIQWGMI